MLKGCSFVDASQPAELGRLELLAKEQSYRDCRLAVCLDRSQFNLSQVEAPAVETAELSQALAWRVKDHIDFPLEELVLDYVQIPQTRSAIELLYAVTSRESTIRQIVDQAADTSGRLERIDIPALALQNIVSRLPHTQEGIALLNLTRHDSLLILGRGEKLYLSREIDISRSDLRSGEMDVEGAAMLDRFDDLLLTIQRSLDYYDSMFADPPIRHLLVSTGDLEFDALIDHLGQNLQISASRLNLQEIVGVSGDPRLDPAWYGEFALAVGAALWPPECDA